MAIFGMVSVSWRDGRTEIPEIHTYNHSPHLDEGSCSQIKMNVLSYVCQNKATKIV